MKTYSDREMAQAIFAAANDRLLAAGERSICSQAVFCALASTAPDMVSYTLFEDLSNEDVLQAGYLLLLRRPVDAAALAVWRTRLDESPQVFRTALFNSLLSSREYRNHPIPLSDCPLPLAVAAPQLTLHMANRGLPQRLIRIYQKLPRSLQRVAKRIAGKE